VNPPDEAGFMFRWDYLDESLGRPGQAQWLTIVAENRGDIPRLIEAIDGMNRSSAAPTKTETEREFQLSFSGILGNVRFLVASISAVVVFTILLVSATTMGMNIRERTGELGILKAIGFSRGLLVGLLVAESLLVTLAGWLLGCVGAWQLFAHVDLQSATGGWFTILRVQRDTLALGFVLSVLVALVASGLPAYRSSALSPADALRRVG
jgi:putative ABC transport system permease protein